MSFNQKDNQFNTPHLNTEFDQNEDKILLTSNSKRQLFKDEAQLVQQQPNIKQNVFFSKNPQKQIYLDQQSSDEGNRIKIKNLNGNEKDQQQSFISKDQTYKSEMNYTSKKVTINPSINDTSKKIDDSKFKNPFGWLSLKKRIDSLKYLVKRLELSSLIQIKSKLKSYHLMIIDDKSSHRQYDEKQTKFFEDLVSLDYFFAKMSQFFYTVFRFFPSTTNTKILVVLFKMILALQLTYQIFILPFLISYPHNSINLFSVNEKLYRFIFVIPFILEMILNFNLKYFEHGELISDKYTIILRYIKRDFWWDAVGIAGTGLIDENSSVAFILLIFFIRFIKFKSMYNSIEEKFQLTLRFPVSFTIINLILAITVLAHVFGCIFQFIGLKMYENGSINWLEKADLIDKSILDRYIASLYFSFITMISVGYGDITPINNVERIFVTCMTVFSCGTFAYVVNIIGSLFQQLQINEAEYRQQRYEMSNYMKNRNIDSELQTKVFQYLEMLKLKKQWEPESGQSVIEIMNPKLKESIYKDYYGRYLKQCKLFSQKFSPQFLEMLSVACKEQVFGPGEIIFYQKEQQINFHEDESNKLSDQYQNIHLVIKGKALLFQDNGIAKLPKKTIMDTKTKYSVGECFAVKEFLCGVPYEFTAQSKGLTTVIKIQRSHFLEVLNRFPKDYEAYCALRDEILFYEEDKYIKCQPCSRYDHSTFSCPRMHYLKQKQKAILKYTHSFSQTDRSCFDRKNRKKVKSVGKNLEQVKRDLKLYRVQLIISKKRQYQSMQKEIQSRFVLLESNNIFKKQSQLESPQFLAVSNQPVDQESSNEEETIRQREQGSIAKSQMQTSSRQLTQEEKELMEIAQEYDEYFYLKCPLVSWNQQSKMYEMSPEQEEYEGSIAIQCYLEQNFDIKGTLENINILDLFEEIQNEEEEEDNEDNQNESSKNIIENLIGSANKDNLNKYSLKSIAEEDNLIQMSDSSLSFDAQDQIQEHQVNELVHAKHSHEKEKNLLTKCLEKRIHLPQSSQKEENNSSIFLENKDPHLPDNQHVNYNPQPFQKKQQSNQGEQVQKTDQKPSIHQEKIDIPRRSKHLMSFKQLKSLLSFSLDINSQKNKTPRTSYQIDTINQIQGLDDVPDQNKTSNQEFSNQQRTNDNQNSIMTLQLLSKQSGKNHSAISRPSLKKVSYLSRQPISQIQPRQSININTQDNNHFPQVLNSFNSAQKINSLSELVQTQAQNQNQNQIQQQQQSQQSQPQTQNNLVSLQNLEINNIFLPQIQNQQIDQMLNFIFNQFEKPQSFSKYFTKGNLENIIKKYIRYQDQFTIKFINNNQFINQKSGKYMSLTPQAKQQKTLNTKREASKFSKK